MMDSQMTKMEIIMDNNLLKYQELDKSLIAKLNNSDSKLKTDLQNAIAETKKWQANILELEQISKKLLEEYNKLMQVQSKGVAFVDKFNNVDIDKMQVTELEDFALKTKQTANQLEELAKRITEHQNNVKTVVQNYKVARKNWIECKTKRDDLKQKNEDELKKNQPEIEAIKKEMISLEKTIDGAKIAKYKSTRQDGIFPVLVPLQENRCGGCRMQLSTSAIEKLKVDGLYECEQCRRLIYFEGK